MSVKRKQDRVEFKFKAKVALEAIKGRKTTNEISHSQPSIKSIRT